MFHYFPGKPSIKISSRIIENHVLVRQTRYVSKFDGYLWSDIRQSSRLLRDCVTDRWILSGFRICKVFKTFVTYKWSLFITWLLLVPYGLCNEVCGQVYCSFWSIIWLCSKLLHDCAMDRSILSVFRICPVFESCKVL